MQSGLHLVQFLLTIAGAVLAALGLALWAMETGSEQGQSERRRRLSGNWRSLSQASWGDLIPCLTACLVKKSERLIRLVFQEADQGVGFGGVVIFVLFVFIPIAAALNALIGGSPFLFLYYLSLLVVLALLNFFGEFKGLRFLSSLAAVYLGLSFFIIIPVYVLHSFTDVTINYYFSHSVLKSLLVAVIWYVAAYGIGLMIDAWFRSRGVDPARSPTARFISQFLAALPIAYVLTFLALLAGHLGVLEQSPDRPWQLVVSSTVITALSLPTTILLLGFGVRNRPMLPAWLLLTVSLGIVYSAILALFAYTGTHQDLSQSGILNVLIGLSPDGRGLYLGSQFWVIHLPFLPTVGVIFIILSAGMVKGVIRGLHVFSNHGAIFQQPFLISALTCAGWAFLFWVAALMM